MNEINTINETNTITTSNTGKEPMKNLAHEITYRRYLLSKDDAKSIFKDINIAEYIALHFMCEQIESDSIYSDRIYLSEISEKLNLPIRKTSKLIREMSGKNLINWDHDGEKIRACSICGETETKVIPMTGTVSDDGTSSNPSDTTTDDNSSNESDVTTDVNSDSTSDLGENQNPSTGVNAGGLISMAAIAIIAAGTLVAVSRKRK